MIATDSGAADALILIGVILIAACVVCCVLAVLEKPRAVDPTAPALRSVPYAGYAAALGWAGVGVAWLGTLVT